MNKAHLDCSPVLTAKAAGMYLKVSLSWLAKAPMRGDGPPYSCIGRSVRHAEATLIHWMKSQQRFSTGDKGGRPAVRETFRNRRWFRNRHSHNWRLRSTGCFCGRHRCTRPTKASGPKDGDTVQCC